MGWLEDVVAQLQGGAGPQAFLPPASAFPDVKAPQTDPLALWAQIEGQQQADNAAADRRNTAGMTRAPIRGGPQFADNPLGMAGLDLAMNNAPPGTGIPVPDNSQFVPFSIGGPAPSPSVQQAKAMTAPPAPPSGPAMPPAAAPPPTMGEAAGEGAAPLAAAGATDLSAARRAAAPASINPAAVPMSMAPQVPAQRPFADRLADVGGGLVALGANLRGETGPGERIAAAREAKAEQARQEGLALGQRNATAQLLASKGATPAEIQAAVAGGPETLKALVGQYFTKDKYSVVQAGEDKYGGKTFKVFNSSDGTTKELPGDNAADARATAQRQDMEGLTGADRLSALEASDPAYARKVKSAINGDISLPTGNAALKPAGRKFIEDVLAVDGTVSEADFKIRSQLRKNYTTGKDFQVTKSINTVVDHGMQLEKAIEKLNNNNYFSAISNPVRDALLSQTDPEYIKAKQAFKTNAENFAREMDFALSGGRPTVSGAQHQREAFDALAAQVGQKEALRKSIELLDARLKEHQRGYAEALPPGTKEGIVPHLEKKTTDFIDRILGNQAPAAAKPKVVKPGNYVFKNGVLVPE